jgi:hypothetical protein
VLQPPSVADVTKTGFVQVEDRVTRGAVVVLR